MHLSTLIHGKTKVKVSLVNRQLKYNKNNSPDDSINLNTHSTVFLVAFFVIHIDIHEMHSAEYTQRYIPNAECQLRQQTQLNVLFSYFSLHFSPNSQLMYDSFQVLKTICNYDSGN